MDKVAQATQEIGRRLRSARTGAGLTLASVARQAGLSEGFIRSVNEALSQHELVKIKFVEFKEQKKALAPQLAETTMSHLIMRVGNVAVLHRPRPATETKGAPRAV